MKLFQELLSVHIQLCFWDELRRGCANPDGTQSLLFCGVLDPALPTKIYSFSFLAFVYFLPLLCIILSYTFIIILIRRWQIKLIKSFLCWTISDFFRREFSGLGYNSEETHSGFALFFTKRWKNFRMSVIQVIVFAVFWAPYIVQQSW